VRQASKPGDEWFTRAKPVRRARAEVAPADFEGEPQLSRTSTHKEREDAERCRGTATGALSLERFGEENSPGFDSYVSVRK